MAQIDIKTLKKDLKGIEFLRNAVEFFNGRDERINDNKNPIELLKEYEDIVNGKRWADGSLVGGVSMRDKLLDELKKAKESKISSWIDEVSKKLELLDEFFKVAERVGLVEDGHYIDGKPSKGSKEDIYQFYKLEDELDYPVPQKID